MRPKQSLETDFQEKTFRKQKLFQQYSWFFIYNESPSIYMSFIENYWKIPDQKNQFFFVLCNGKQPRGTYWSREDDINKDFGTRFKTKANYRKTLILKLSEILQKSS